MTAGATAPVVPGWRAVCRAVVDVTSRLTTPGMPDTPPSLEELMVAVAGGDAAAFGDLYDRVAGLVYGIVLRVVRDPAQSEEVAQDVMAEMWRTAGRFDPARGGVKGWIAVIAHRRAVDLVRSVQKGRDRARTYGIVAAAGAHYDSVEAEAIVHAEHDQVRSALGELSASQREAIELAYYDGLTYRQVAERIGAPVGTVKTRMRDGLSRLRTILGTAGG